MSWCQFFKVQEEEERWLMYLYLPESLTSSLSPCVRRKKKASREEKKRGVWGGDVRRPAGSVWTQEAGRVLICCRSVRGMKGTERRQPRVLRDDLVALSLMKVAQRVLRDL